MKKKKTVVWIIIAVVIAALAAVGYKIYDLMFNGAVKVQMVDLIAAIKQCRLQLVIGGSILVIGAICLVIGRIQKGAKRQIFTVQGGVAVVLALVITISWICLGPQYSVVNNVLSGNLSLIHI